VVLKAHALTSGVYCTNVKELADLAQTDQTAADVFTSFAKNFASFVADRITREKPDRLVIGGNIAKAHQLFFDKLKIHLTPYMDPSCIGLANLGEDAALIGAAFTFDINSFKIQNQ
jgi:glucokinase